VEVEDHPIEYEDFQGVIPEKYGVWSWSGPRRIATENLLNRCVANYIWCSTEKAKGEWTLGSDSQRFAENQWLLLKTGTNARPPSKKHGQSAKTGRTMKQIAGDRDAE
jgi:bifunctional non-homologous end joining protein LigD